MYACKVLFGTACPSVHGTRCTRVEYGIYDIHVSGISKSYFADTHIYTK